MATFWHFVACFGSWAVFHDEVQHFLVSGLDEEEMKEFHLRATMNSSFGPQGIEMPRRVAEQEHIRAHGLGWGDCSSCRVVMGVN